jgi:hypothetical protein
VRAEGGYEILSGHRRRRASELAGLTEIPARVLDVDDETAIIIMTDTNLVRPRLLPSEKAFAYKMKMDAIRRKAGRKPNLTDIESPDPTVTLDEMSEYGYTSPDMFPLSVDRAIELLGSGHSIYRLYPDNTEAMVDSPDEIRQFEGLLGVERGEWELTVKLGIDEEASAEAIRCDYYRKHSQDEWAYYLLEGKAAITANEGGYYND